NWNELLLGSALAALSAYLCIHFFIRLLDRTGMLPYGIYRLLLGTVLLILFWEAIRAHFTRGGCQSPITAGDRYPEVIMSMPQLNHRPAASTAASRIARFASSSAASAAPPMQ
ncbi:MAG: hypothetical protein Q8N33_02155, partial [Rhodocyclaceae bacterium]|nr:hypothetical protein [Rhodocyclaceae bacterium]